jgi:hypothetical protein
MLRGVIGFSLCRAPSVFSSFSGCPNHIVAPGARDRTHIRFRSAQSRDTESFGVGPILKMEINGSLIPNTMCR